MEDIIAGLYNIHFTIFKGITSQGEITIYLGNIAKTIKNLYNYQNTMDIYGTMGNATANVSGGIIAISLAILSLMVLIDFIQQSLRFNKDLSWEMILFTCVKMAVYVFFINNSRRFFKDCFYTGIHMLDISKFTEKDMSTGLSSAVKDAIKNYKALDGIFSGLNPIVGSLVYGILAIPVLGSQIALLSAVVQKFIKFTVLAWVSPLPIALSYGGGGPAARGFIMQTISSIVDVIVTFLILIIYCAGLQNIDTSNIFGSAIGLLFYNGVFSALINESTHMTHDMIRG